MVKRNTARTARRSGETDPNPSVNGHSDVQLLATIGKSVRALRRRQGLTIRALADGSGLSPRFLSDLEGGKANISVVKLSSVARALGTVPVRLLGTDQAKPEPSQVIALLGLRGAGKSTVGKLLAEALGLKFYELDKLIEDEAGIQLAELFAIHGEDYYRRTELAVLRRFLSEHPRAVLATGGGVVTSPEALRLLSERTRTVWLKATPEEHWNRVVEQGDLRPIQNRPQAMAELRRRLRERERLYGQAQITAPTSGRTISAVVSELVRRLETRAWKRLRAVRLRGHGGRHVAQGSRSAARD